MAVIIVSTVILAVIYDANGTARLVATSLSVGGLAWICKKITEQINKDASQIIYFTGLSMAGISVVRIIGNAIGSMDKVAIFFNNVSQFLDKVTFWN